jgi:hypothetical protein
MERSRARPYRIDEPLEILLMPNDKHTVRGNNLNDPDARPADIADHEQRTNETRTEETHTGDGQDVEGHTPKIPGKSGKA